ncbi:MAG: DEAD/DEAH box helicase [Eubacteriales bacterium]|nr:DEAD/DEAH box helicase [Eubacteriales bacterium]MDD3880777.1 DEAD/DEAH box helicase [Eubacteriales bacterium]MDD4511856.1 DEAD/DEAH box helicase [Eubacteriales bacterium]
MMSQLSIPTNVEEDGVEYQAGRLLYTRGGVRPYKQEQTRLIYMVAGSPRREVSLPAIGKPSCSCDAYKETGICRHIYASEMQAKESGALSELKHHCYIASAPLLLTAMEASFLQDSNISLEVTLMLEKKDDGTTETRVGLRLGEDRFYVVRSIPLFLDAISDKKPLVFGKGFSFEPAWMNFSRSESSVLDMLRELCQSQNLLGQDAKTALCRTLPLPPASVKHLLSCLKTSSFRISQPTGRISEGKPETVINHINGIVSEDIKLRFNVGTIGRTLNIHAEFPPDLVFLTEDSSYVLCGGRVIELSQKQLPVLQALRKASKDGEAAFEYPPDQAQRVISELIPYLEMCGTVEMEGLLKARIIRMPLTTKLYLDREGRDIICRTKFCYGMHEIDPFASLAETENAESEQPRFLMRDAKAERRILDELASSGFRVRKGRVYLCGQDAIYSFVSGGAQRLAKQAEVYLSSEFKKMTPRKPNLSGVMSVNGGKLELRMTESGKPSAEILSIMQALHDRRSYFMLMDGSILDLTGMENWYDAADTITESAEAAAAPLQPDLITLSNYKTAYMTAMLRETDIPIEQDESAKAVTDTFFGTGLPCPDPVGKLLRPYQTRGFEWLQSLHRLKMGGILADDMGLGKTIQMIALLWLTHETEGAQPSILIAPTSLTYNWQAEIARFAPKLRVMVLSGGQSARQAQIEQLKEKKNVDVLVTSYPLIRRDIDRLSGISFRFAVLDEAQHIKNAQSVGALAVKQLTAETRFALTGTPMENHPGELWSIFDFILPGYLPPLSSYMKRYGEGKHSDDLRRRIRPFLLRRLKSDVLTELPPKIENIVYTEMTPEQSKVYQASLALLSQKVDTLLKQKGAGRGRIEVLAAITELRQICCHPRLCMPGYSGTSGKLDALFDILPGAIEAGRRVLLFSQFTSMLQILLKQMESEGISCLYLDGDTPPKQRLQLAQRFNEGEGSVFLISLKAGGTGLNLTGADMVIHYDPWWNPAAEDQATDRAHRIGQTHVVEVIRLITHQTVEEQVVKLGKRKRAMFDQLITAGEEMPTQLSEDDIRALFRT